MTALGESDDDGRTGEIRTFVEEFVAPRAEALETGTEGPGDLVGQLAQRGFLAAHIPSDYGGSALDMRTYGELHARLGAESSSLRSLLTVHDMVAEVVLRLGSEHQRRSWLPQLTGGDTKAAFALTEPGAGSDAAAITTTAVPTDHGYRISGQKCWISFGQLADVFLVAAKLGSADGPIGAFLVPRDTDGMNVEQVEGMLGLRGSMLAGLVLGDCEIPEECRVGPERMPAGLVVGTALHHGRHSVAWGCVGIGEACRDASLEYSKQRVQFGSPLSEHQLIRRMLTNMITEVRAARLLCENAAEQWARRDAPAIEATLIAKYFSSGMASRVAGDAVQIHGARGMAEGFAVERHFRDARVMEIIEGSNEMQQLLIADYALRASGHGSADE